MNKVSVKLLSLVDADSLFEFEVENHSYFDTIGLSRSDAYYNRASFQEIIENLVAEQEKDIHYMYLVMNAQGEVVGRVNLTQNIGSQIVLIKNGFQFVGKYSQYILKDDGWADSLLFEKVLDLTDEIK